MLISVCQAVWDIFSSRGNRLSFHPPNSGLPSFPTQQGWILSGVGWGKVCTLGPWKWSKLIDHRADPSRQLHAALTTSISDRILKQYLSRLPNFLKRREDTEIFTGFLCSQSSADLHYSNFLPCPFFGPYGQLCKYSLRVAQRLWFVSSLYP